jgi:hypothetical protein
MINRGRIDTTTHSVTISNCIFFHLSYSGVNGGGAVLINNNKLTFDCSACVVDSCRATGYGGGFHVMSSMRSNIQTLCGRNCSTPNAGQLSRAVVHTSEINVNALISLVACAPRDAPGGHESLISAHGKYSMHDINASDCHIEGVRIVAPHNTLSDGYVKFITIADSSALVASRIVENALTVSYFNIVNNNITTSIFSTMGTPTCENSCFINNHCDTLVTGVQTTFKNCHFDKIMTGSFTTESCVVNQFIYTTVEINEMFVPICFGKVFCREKSKSQPVVNFACSTSSIFSIIFCFVS